MSDNEITLAPLSSYLDDPAEPSRQETASQVPTADASASTASHRDTQAEQDVPLDDSDTPVDPRIAALRAMFPDYDDSLLQSILLSVEGDQNSAIDVLLGMSDPQYKSEIQHDHAQAFSQVDLDEQLARRLMLEEQHAAQQAQAQQQPIRLPYEPYTSSARRAPRPQQQPQTYPNNANDERDTVTDIQDRFGRIAETGKKTFESLFSKVKAKIQEYDKPSKPELPNQEPQWVGVSTSAPSQRWSYNNADVQQAPYYDPNLSNSPSPPLPVASKPLPSPMTTKGYDVDTEQTTGSAGPSRSESDPASHVSNPRTSMGTRSITAIDGGKLGLLPKRPVSLLKQQETEPAKEQHSVDDDDDDGLEYAENPFEDQRK